MPIATDPTRTWEYILKEDRGSDHPTRFVLGVVTVADEAALQDRLVAVDAETKTTRVASGSHALEVLRRGLRGWVDFLFASGDPVPFKTDPGRRSRGIEPPTDATLDYLTPAQRKELADAIIERNALTEADRKNSSPAPAS